MSYLKSSPNYIWNTSAVLGRGATGSVYQGMNKISGEVVAVKSFNHLSHMRPYDVQRREFEVLSKVNHENIVRLIAIEEELESQHKVLIMELCTGGSLFNILEDPANSFGLEDAEFILVLKHLAAGMKHLRDLKIIHRDLKPGNIMKFLSEDGQSVYKLTDFGAARELEEDQQFMSLYGTEEYLHPDLYERAVLKKPAGKSFSAKVDLWSIGVTLYHIATGSLPFRPHGGRKNKEMMHRITTEKKSGMISGIQHSENGEIEWSATMPKTCLLSQALQEKITPLLAGLLECSPKHMWTFEKFFDTVTHILSHRPFHVFFVNGVCDYTLYLQPADKLSFLKQRLASKDYSQVPLMNQLMIWNKREITDIEQIMETSIENPVILLNSESTSIKAVNLMPPNHIKFPEILISISCEQDSQLSKACASIAYCIQRNASKCLLHYNLINQVPHNVMSLIEGNVKLLNEKRASCSHLIDSMRDQIEYTSKTTENLGRCTDLVDSQSNTGQNINDNDINDIKNSFELLEKTWKELLPRMIYMSNKVGMLSDIWQKEPPLYVGRIRGARSRSEYLCTKIKESWVFLHKNKSSRAMAGNESQLHHLEKIRVDNNCKKLIRSLFDDCYQAINEIVEKLEDWYTDAQVALVQSECLFKELSLLMGHRDSVHRSLNGATEHQSRKWQQLVSQITTVVNSKPTNKLDDAAIGNYARNKTESNTNNTHPQSVKTQSYLCRMSANAPSIAAGCSHKPEALAEELQNLVDTQRLLYASLSENQNLFSELVSITFSTRNQKGIDSVPY